MALRVYLLYWASALLTVCLIFLNYVAFAQLGQEKGNPLMDDVALIYQLSSTDQEKRLAASESLTRKGYNIYGRTVSVNSGAGHIELFQAALEYDGMSSPDSKQITAMGIYVALLSDSAAIVTADCLHDCARFPDLPAEIEVDKLEVDLVTPTTLYVAKIVSKKGAVWLLNNLPSGYWSTVPKHCRNYSCMVRSVAKNVDEIRELAKIPLNKFIDSLIKMAGHSDPNVREAALAAVGLGGKSVSKALPMVIKNLDDANLCVRASACEALGALDQTRAEGEIFARMRDLMELIKSAKWSPPKYCKQRATHSCLKAAGKRALPTIEEALSTTDHELKHDVLDALRLIEDDTLSAIMSLITIIRKAEKLDWTVIGGTFYWFVGLGEDAIPTLSSYLADPSINVRYLIINGLSYMESEKARTLALDSVRPLVNHESDSVRRWAGTVVVRMGRPFKRGF